MLPRQPQAVPKRRQKHACCCGGSSMTISFKFLDDLFLAGDLALQLSDVSLRHIQKHFVHEGSRLGQSRCQTSVHCGTLLGSRITSARISSSQDQRSR